MNLSSSFQLKFSVNHDVRFSFDCFELLSPNVYCTPSSVFLQDSGPSVIQNPEGAPMDVSAALRQFYLCSLSSSQQNTTRSDFHTNVTASD